MKIGIKYANREHRKHRMFFHRVWLIVSTLLEGCGTFLYYDSSLGFTVYNLCLNSTVQASLQDYESYL